MIVLQFFSFKEATKNKVALASLSICQVGYNFNQVEKACMQQNRNNLYEIF